MEMLNRRCRRHFKSFGENPTFSPKQGSTEFFTSTLNNSFDKNCTTLSDGLFKVLVTNSVKGSICENQSARDNAVA